MIFIFRTGCDFRNFILRKREFKFFYFFIPDFLPCIHNLLFFRIYPASNICLGFVGLNKFQPVFIWLLVFRSYYFNLVSAAKFCIERHYSSIDLCSYTMVTNFTMNIESKIDGCGIKRQSSQISFGSEGINFILVKIEFKAFQQIFSRIKSACIFKYISYPVRPIFKVLIRGRFIFFIFPVCSHTFFSNFVHLFGSDLHFYKSSIKSHNSCVN